MTDSSQITIFGAGSVIRKLRNDREISIADLGQRIDVSRSLMCRYEKDERGLTVDAIRRIAEVLCYPSEQLLAACLFVAFPELKDAKIDKSLKKIVNSLIESDAD